MVVTRNDIFTKILFKLFKIKAKSKIYLNSRSSKGNYLWFQRESETASIKNSKVLDAIYYHDTVLGLVGEWEDRELSDKEMRIKGVLL